MKAVKAARKNLGWVDEFWQRAGAHIFARAEDGVLILPPNRVYKLNPTAVRLVEYLQAGGRIRDLSFPNAQARSDSADFFGDLAALYRGELAVNGTVSADTFSFNFTRLPVLAELAITYRCNNACRFCYAGCGATAQAVARRPELTTDQYKRIIDIFVDEARVPFFSFTGGEPCLRDDLEELIAYATSRRIVTNLVTNATLIDQPRALALKRAGLGSAQASLEAPEAVTHDELTGRQGAFKATLAGIKALQLAAIPVQTNTTLTRRNLAMATDFPAFLASLGIERFAMNLFIPTVHSPVTAELFVSYDVIGPVVDAVVQAAKQAGLVFYWYSPTPFCFFNPIARGLGNKSCAAADGLLSVAPDGTVLPCSSWDYSLGNLMTNEFKAIWFSAAAADLKQKRFAPAECQKDCSAFVACQAACPLYWRYVAGTADDAIYRPFSNSLNQRSLV